LGAESTAVLENYLNPGGFVPLHYHNTEEVLICLEGAGKIMISNKDYDFSSGCTVIVPPGLVHEIKNIGKEHLRLLGIFPVAEPQTTWLEVTL
jgi:quercetin dioxygenase-like cupin family protein